MSTDPRVNKSLERNIDDLDAHLYILRKNLHDLRNSSIHLKVVAAELRTLICYSGKVEGLLWRLTKELSVEDSVFLNLAGDLDTDNPLTKHISFLLAPISRGDKPHPGFTPQNYSFKSVVKEAQALVADGKPLTHQYLINAIAQQIGTAHEAEKVEPALVQLSSIFINGVEPFIQVLAMDAELTLEVGERVLECAERKMGFIRRQHSPDQGNLSVVACINVKKIVLEPTRIFRLNSYVALVDIDFYLTPTGLDILFRKHGLLVMRTVETFPEDIELGNDILYVFSYSSFARQLRTFFPDDGVNEIVSCDLGWIYAEELYPEQVTNSDVFEWGYIATFKSLLSSRDVSDISEGKLFISEEESLAKRIFPE